MRIQGSFADKMHLPQKLSNKHKIFTQIMQSINKHKTYKPIIQSLNNFVFMVKLKYTFLIKIDHFRV